MDVLHVVDFVMEGDDFRMTKTTGFRVALCAFLLLLGVWGSASCSNNTTGQEPTTEATDNDGGGGSDTNTNDTTSAGQSYTLGSFKITVDKTQFKILRQDGSVLLESPVLGSAGDKALPALLGWRKSDPVVAMNFGMFLFDETEAPKWSITESFSVESSDDKSVTLKAGDATGTLTLENPEVLRVNWKVSTPGANRVVQSFACGKEERFFGMGAKVHGSEHRGEVLPAWVSEQGIDKIRRKTPGEGFPITGDIHDAYLAVPYIMSSRGFGLLVEDSRRSVFHICAADAPDRWSVELWHNELKFLVINGPKPLDIVERLTAITGRPRLLPKWALAPWMDAIYGQDKVLKTAEKYRTEKIPSSVIWTEDWVGAFEDARGYHLKYQWKADTTLYPDVKKMTDQLHAKGFKFFGYFNSFIKRGLPHWEEALKGNHTIKDKDGKPIQFSGVFFEDNTLPDLTRPETIAWIKGYMSDAIKLGIDGWMADYGEWLPLNTVMHDGRTGWEAHNLYPVMWQKLNREVFDKERPDGDYVFFVRSGWTGTGGLAPVVWAGDQQTEFGGGDGLRSVIPIAINSGVSGIPVMTHDIAGYSSIGVPPSTKELFFRWTQLGAFSPIFRTHHGSFADRNWHWDKDKETIDMFRTYTKIHIAMFPYRYHLAKLASEKGYPMMRHLHLHYPEDPKVARIDDQFLLGESVLVAPVQKDKATEREVYLPKGVWYHYFTEAPLEGGKSHTVKAGLQEIPVFVKAGAILPEFAAEIDTLAKSTDKDVKDLTAAEEGPLRVRVYTGASSNFTLYDGTTFALEHKETPKGEPTVTVDGTEFKACQGDTKENCVMKTSDHSVEAYVTNSTGFTLQSKQGGKDSLTFTTAKAPKARTFIVRIVW
ncbi:MAG: hypothetical protein EP343_24145 [Deltaproteobacteria bacterium]|nr:MAG: hypothetical protein EP343_24145 [Deltaproteobacteria bacterium]